MVKRLLGKVVEEEWPIWSLFIAFMAMLAIAMLVVLLMFFGPSLRDLRGESFDPTALTNEVRLEIGGTLFAIPANYTRYGGDRHAGVAEHVELHALLPDLSGYQSDKDSEFRSMSASSNLILMALVPIEDKLTPSSMRDQLYLPQIAYFETADPNGLKKGVFKEESVYRGDLFYMPIGQINDAEMSPFYLCRQEQNESQWCSGRIRIGQTAQVLFRLPLNQMSQWQVINQKLTSLLKDFRAEARRIN